VKGGALVKSVVGRTVLAVFLLSALLPPDSLAQAPTRAVATGSAAMTTGDGTHGIVSFSAIREDDVVSGQIEFQDPAPIPDQDGDGTGDPALAGSPSGVTVHAKVNCLAVEGHAAIVGGEVTHSNLPRYVGKQVLLFVEDSERSHGRLSWGFYERPEGAFCDSHPWAAYRPVVIQGGGFQVYP
jgi:hypothetical protein